MRLLCRTNAEAVRQLLVAADTGRKAALVGGGAEIRRLAAAACGLRAGTGTDHPELFAFRTWGEVQEYVEQDAGGSDLKVFVQLIDTYGPEVVIDIMDRLSPEEAAEVVVSTAHKAKGREWLAVRVAADFPRAPPQPQRPADPGAPHRRHAGLCCRHPGSAHPGP